MGKCKAEIARVLEVDRSTICREIKRNGRVDGRYTTRGAWTKAEAARPDRFERVRKIRGRLERKVVEKLLLGWSPQQIAGRLKLEGDEYVSHESIYRYIAWKRQLGGTLHLCLRRMGRKPKAYRHGRRFDKRYWDRKFIDQRPARIGMRAEIGHWEMDLLEGQRSKIAVLTMIERKTRYARLRKIKSHKPAHVVKRALDGLAKLPCKVKTITNDNGIEFKNHRELAKASGAQIYFTNPYSWERGSIENLNGLLRQYLPKGKSLRDLSDEKLDAIQNTLNNRPRASLGFRTPEELMLRKKQRLFLRKPPIYEET